MITVEDVRRIALELPGAYEHASHGGQPSFRTKPRMFTWIRDEPVALALWVESEEDKHALIASEPKKFFTTPHYDGYPMVLVDMKRVGVKEATELITESWRLRAPKKLVKDWDAARG